MLKPSTNIQREIVALRNRYSFPSNFLALMSMAKISFNFEL